ncbi:MAG: hypothetical protein GY948_19050 [Alphaproteobacteria bacterium]|nr:hypothetical protein [Alphaproteobacteria bacterium]
MTAKAKFRFELAGWVLFTLSAAFFTLSSLKSGDLAAITGSALFFVACLVFMRPLLSSQKCGG